MANSARDGAVVPQAGHAAQLATEPSPGPDECASTPRSESEPTPKKCNSKAKQVVQPKGKSLFIPNQYEHVSPLTNSAKAGERTEIEG
jgi:hypothetical protein